MWKVVETYPHEWGGAEVVSAEGRMGRNVCHGRLAGSRAAGGKVAYPSR